MALKHFSKDKDPKIDWANVDMEALQMLDDAREYAGIPFRITSHRRSESKDMELAGFVGAHTLKPCGAFDISANTSSERFKIVGALIRAGFPRIGINAKNGHIHVDNGGIINGKVLPLNVLWIE